MPIITLTTIIGAPVDRCFDLSRSIDLHKISTAKTNEEAIAGVKTGLIGLNESVTWKAKHFGIVQQLSTKITEFDYPHYFVDEMLSGAFKRFKHEHKFEPISSGTKMTDIFDYDSPLGFIGKIVDRMVLEKYMIRLLKGRNIVIKDFAESEKWREVLTN